MEEKPKKCEYLANGVINPMNNPENKMVFKIEREKKPLTKSQKNLIKQSKPSNLFI